MGEDFNKISELARLHKQPLHKVAESLRYAKEHPYDTLQPSDPLFKKVYAKQIDEQERVDRRRKDDELEAADLRKHAERKTGMDKVHKKYIVT